MQYNFTSLNAGWTVDSCYLSQQADYFENKKAQLLGIVEGGSRTQAEALYNELGFSYSINPVNPYGYRALGGKANSWNTK